MKYWWVSQKQTHKQEIGGGYMWSPKRQKNGHEHFSYRFMKSVEVGDVVFSYANSKIIAVGVAQTHCYPYPKPSEFGSAGDNWSNEGWMVDVNYQLLQTPIRTIDHINELRHLLPKQYSPVNADTGYGVQAYLFQISKEFSMALAALIDGDAVRVVEGLLTSDALVSSETVNSRISKWEDRIEAEIGSDDEIIETQKTSIVESRRGQGKFRKLLLELEPVCRITGVGDPSHLIASHIKPWRSSTNKERLDPENGFMLTPSIDHLFDKGFISFDNNGSVLLADITNRVVMNQLGVIRENVPSNIGGLRDGQKGYLNWHRESIFLG